MAEALMSLVDRKAAGHACRTRLSRSAHAQWVPQGGRADPVSVIAAQDAGRIADLLPLRYGRMRTDPFAFLRGAAAVMAADLGTCADTGLLVQAGGDAHLANFGAVAGLRDDGLFDITDFDETARAPFEWDLKRLATSLVVAGRVQGLADKACRALARRAAHGYRREIEQLALVSPLDAWHARIGLDAAIDDIADRDVRRAERHRLHHAVQTARDGYRHLVSHDGTLRLPERPPAIYRIGQRDETAHAAFAAYIDALPEDRAVLLRRYRLRDVGFKAVGVGSVGTFCAIGLFATPEGDALLLQLKQARDTVLAPFVAPCGYDNQGQRVVVGQRMMQAEPDLFLGWARVGGQDFYVRQLKDPRLAAILAATGGRIEAASLPFYARLCGRTLARAHARSGDAAAISGYLGDGDSFDEACAQFALAYADQTARDHQAFLSAIASGRIIAKPELRI